MLSRVLRLLRRRWRTLAITAVLLVCAMAAPTAWAYTTTADRRKPPVDVPATPVALVLGAGIRPDGTPSLSLKGRLDVAADLHRRGKVKVLLVSGDNRTKDYDEPTLMRKELIRRGVPAHRIVQDYAGRDTWDSCTRAKRIFGVHRLTVVTQNFHLPRAVALCRAAGLDTWGVAHTVWYRGSTEIGYTREPLAMIKAMTDLTLRPDPAVLGSPDPGVRNALAAE
ncbi:vancomycin high temperature exclusion protein [Actinomadura adrarensis]|uniref:Vancomycin high temperature exclusion protein n=1 Tax=Actinomadura adrarensis TaxID=1819600 RepID=A0ABW3CSN0_9ACTN